MWLGGRSSHFDIKFMHVEVILTEIFERIYRAKSTFESDL